MSRVVINAYGVVGVLGFIAFAGMNGEGPARWALSFVLGHVIAMLWILAARRARR
jgi:hypothetical protein